MKNYTLHIPEGVKDFLGYEAELKEYIQNQIKQLFQIYGYQLVETPTFEYLDVFTLGENTFQSPELYKWVNRQGELVALRSDMTRSIARVVATQNSNLKHIQRYAYVANSFRYPERYQGKIHEFTQAGVELIGEKSCESDAEVIKLAIEALRAAGVEDFTIHLGSAVFLSHMLKEMGLDENDQEKVYKAIEQKDAVSLKAILDHTLVESEVKGAIFSLIQTAGTIELLQKVKGKVTSDGTQEALGHLENIYAILEDYGVSEYILFDLSVLSYASYYTGIMFQAFTKDVGSAVVEGGRYDTLLKAFGKDLPAVGFGMNINLILQKLEKEALNQKDASQKTLIVYTPQARKLALQVGEQFRRQGLVVENCLSYTIEEALRYGKQSEVGGVLYFKDEEKVTLYNIEKGTNECVGIESLLKG